MKILVLTNSSWDDTNAVGNTLSNWFSHWDNAEFSTIYSRDESPNNTCCSSYFVVSLSQIIKNIFTPWKIGQSFDNKDIVNENKSRESYLINATRGKKIKKLFILLNDLVFSSNIWLNRKLKKYIEETKPDICFTFGIGEPFRYSLCKYLKSLSIPVVLFIADDVYGAYKSSNDYVSRRQRKRFEEMVKFANKVYGASEMMCEAYSREFDINIQELYKGCSISLSKKHYNKPIRIAYAGNLFYGRAKTLGIIAETLKIINKNKGDVAQLEIYTGTPITSDVEMMLGREGVSRVMGKRTYTEITNILKDVDIVLHVESFEKKQIDIVRYSFSTKIIDCLQSGSVLMVVGPQGIASVEFPRNLPGAIVVDEINDLEGVLDEVLKHPDELIKRAASINAIAVETFPIDKVRAQLYNDFLVITHQS